MRIRCRLLESLPAASVHGHPSRWCEQAVRCLSGGRCGEPGCGERLFGGSAGTLGFGQKHPAATDCRPGGCRVGRIWITGEEATSRSVQDRNLGFVFQHFALFKQRTVRQNIGFGLELRGWQHGAIRRRVDELLDLVQMQGFGGRYPSQLFGGQHQPLRDELCGRGKCVA